jgi:hypothetical protein
MAVQNMWLTCAEMGIGAYWSTPKAALEANEFLGLRRAIILFLMSCIHTYCYNAFSEFLAKTIQYSQTILNGMMD